MSDDDIRHEVQAGLGAHVDAYDVDGIVREILDTYGRLPVIDVIDEDTYSEILNRHHLLSRRDGPYSREEYERACVEAGIAPASDAVCAAGLPGGEGVVLASRRADGVRLERGRPRCEGCGKVITGSPMMASLGLACGIDCYDELS